MTHEPKDLLAMQLKEARAWLDKTIKQLYPGDGTLRPDGANVALDVMNLVENIAGGWWNCNTPKAERIRKDVRELLILRLRPPGSPSTLSD